MKQIGMIFLNLFLLLFISAALANESRTKTNLFGTLQSRNEVLAHPRPLAWQKIKHIVLIIFENTKASNALSQTFFKSLTTKGAYLNQSFAVAHPSQPNYFALIAGSTMGLLTDLDVNLKGKELGDLLEEKGLTWKAYAEDLPFSCFLGSVSANYVRKHEPFISFNSVQNNPAECGQIVPGIQFFTDIIANNLPAFSIYIPNMQNDGHDTSVSFADNWFSNMFGPIFNNATIMKDTLFIVTFDEDDLVSFNHIYTTFIGAGVKVGAQSNFPYNHYNVLRTIEEIFQIGTLGRLDAIYGAISDIWEA